VTTNKASILLVDDDRDLLQLIGMRLSAAGHTVHAATSGEEALARLPVVRPQLVLTDMRMEGMDGMALFERVHAMMPTLPVIILTAHGTMA
jgi:two-component system response regulator GlrR